VKGVHGGWKWTGTSLESDIPLGVAKLKLSLKPSPGLQKRYRIASRDHIVSLMEGLGDLIQDVRSVNQKVQSFEASCFSGVYVTGDVTPEYLAGIEENRAKLVEAGSGRVLWRDTCRMDDSELTTAAGFPGFGNLRQVLSDEALRCARGFAATPGAPAPL